MTSNHDPALVTLFHSTLEHTLEHFLEFWIFEGARHFLGLLNQPPTLLLTLDISRIGQSSLGTIIPRGLVRIGDNHPWGWLSIRC